MDLGSGMREMVKDVCDVCGGVVRVSGECGLRACVDDREQDPWGMCLGCARMTSTEGSAPGAPTVGRAGGLG